MRLKYFLCCSSLLVLLALPAIAAEPLAPRGEVSVKGGTDRSLLTTEFWAPLAQQSDRVLYGDIRLMGDNDDNREGNLGVGYRQIKNDAVVGVHGWIDRRRTQHNSTFHQLTFGVERLGHVIDARANVYIPLNQGRNIVTPNMGVTTPYLAGSGIYYDTNGSINETPQYGLDGELGYRLPILQKQADAIRVYGGGYYFFRDNTVEVPGARFRTEAQINKAVSLGARVQYDKPRGTQGFLEATLKFPFSAKRLYQESGIRSRLDESPERDVDIVTDSKVTDTGLAKPIINTQTGSAQRVLYVDNTNPQTGDGSKQNPYNSLKAAEAALQENDILYINRGDGTTRNMDQGIVIAKPGVQLIGSGTALVYDSGRFVAGNGANYSGIVLKDAGDLPVITNIQTANTDNILGNGILVTADNAVISGIRVVDPQKHGVYVSTFNGETFKSIDISNLSLNVTHNGNNNYALWVVSNFGGTIQNVTLKNINASGANGVSVGIFNASRIDNIVAENINSIAPNGRAIGIIAGGASWLGTASIKNTTSTNSGVGLYFRAENNSTIDAISLEKITANNNTGNGIHGFTDTGGKINRLDLKDATAQNNSAIGLLIEGKNNATIKDINLSNVVANSNTQSGIWVFANGGTVNNVNISNATALSNTQNGVVLSANNTGILNGVNLSRITANNNQQNGLYINGANATTSVINNVSVANSNFLNNTVNGMFLQKANAGATFNVDLGGGAFGSVGQNRSSGNTGKDLRLNYTGGGAVFAKNNWWGDVSGLQAGRVTLSASTTVDSTSFLTTDPRP